MTTRRKFARSSDKVSDSYSMSITFSGYGGRVFFYNTLSALVRILVKFLKLYFFVVIFRKVCISFFTFMNLSYGTPPSPPTL